MGCDIHVVLEYHSECEWKPAFYGTVLHLPRDYKMFGSMAGVRDSSIEPVVEQRYVPEGWDEDDFSNIRDHASHSFSWLTSTEFEEAIKRGNGGAEYKVVLAMMRGFEMCGYPSRIVFGFDS